MYLQIEKLQPKGTVKAFVKAREYYFKANEDAEPAFMTYAAWGKFMPHKARAKWAKEKVTPVLETLVSECLKQMPEDPKVFMSEWLADGAVYFS